LRSNSKKVRPKNFKFSAYVISFERVLSFIAKKVRPKNFKFSAYVISFERVLSFIAKKVKPKNFHQASIWF